MKVRRGVLTAGLLLVVASGAATSSTACLCRMGIAPTPVSPNVLSLAH
jgi:hypothetical protein